MAFDAIWGGTLRDIRWTLDEHRVLLIIEVVNAGVIELYALEFTGVSHLEFVDVDHSAWDYTEVTAVHANSDAGGIHIVRVILWSESSYLIIRCRSVELRATPLVEAS
jgi:hypothetical protein